VDWGETWYDLSGNYLMESRQVRLGNYSDGKVFSLEGNLTSQVHKSHLVKTGLEFRFYDLDYQHYWFEFPAGDIWHLDNVFSGKPVDIAAYIEDKMEYQGITLNIGIRLDAFNTQKKYPESIYDPLAFQEWNGGDGIYPTNTASIWQAHRTPPTWYVTDSTVASDYRGFFPDSVRNDKNTVNSERSVWFGQNGSMDGMVWTTRFRL
jgi:hypothetical protein